MAPEKEDLQEKVSGLQQELHNTEAKMDSLEVTDDYYRHRFALEISEVISLSIEQVGLLVGILLENFIRLLIGISMWDLCLTIMMECQD